MQMSAQERILRNALAVPSNHNFGEGGKAIAKIYRECSPSYEDLLHALAVMANGLADLEQAHA
jgi:hypothetical protein